MIDLACPQCGVIYHTLEANVGKRILCTKCGNVITIVVAVTPRPRSIPVAELHPTTSGRMGRKRLRILVLVGVGAAAVLISFLLLRYANTPQKTVSDHNADDAIKSRVVGEQSAPAAATTEGSSPADPRPTDYNSLPTGTRIEHDDGPNGHGKLTVENGTSEDAVVRLSDATTDQTIRWFFVKAQSSAHMSRIPQGTYRLAYTTGLNWVESEDVFSWQPIYSEFERNLVYDEQRDSEGIQYHTIRVTLNAVLFGNVQTRTITRDEFLKGHRHISLQPERPDAGR